MDLLYLTAITITPWETHQRFMVEVDWDNDGLFANAHSDISSDIFAPVETIRGRDYASQLAGRSVAGELRTMLRNDDGLYSSFNASSSLYGKVLPNRKVRAWALTPNTVVLWTGYLDSLVPAAVSNSPSGEPVASLRATGLMKQMGDQAKLVSPTPQTGVLTSDVVDAILDAADIGDRDVETGAVPIDNWWAEERLALDLLQEIWDETELGFLSEGVDWDLVFENRYHRMLYSGSPVVVFSDDPASSYPYHALTQEDALRNIWNRLTGVITDYTAAASAVVWTLAITDPIYLAPGSSRRFKAANTAGYINPWVTPVDATDIIHTGGTIGVSDVLQGPRSMPFTVTNSHVSQAAYLTTVQARGVLYDAEDPVYIEANDTTSQGLYGKRTYPLPSPWYPNAAYAQAAADYFVSIAKDPHPVLSLSFPGASTAALALVAATLALSDRVTVDATRLLTKLGIASAAFFVESIAHRFGPAIPWETSLLLSPAAVAAFFGIFDNTTYGKFDSTLIFAY